MKSGPSFCKEDPGSDCRKKYVNGIDVLYKMNIVKWTCFRVFHSLIRWESWSTFNNRSTLSPITVQSLVYIIALSNLKKKKKYKEKTKKAEDEKEKNTKNLLTIYNVDEVRFEVEEKQLKGGKSERIKY